MESPQVVCSSPAFCKLEPESPPSWETVDFTESNFGEYWPEDWEDVKDSDGIKNFTNGDMLLDLDLLMKEESFTWIDERNDGLYTNAFDWPSNDVKGYNHSPTAVTIDQKPFVGLSNSVNNNGNSGGVKLYHTNHHSSSLVPATQQQQQQQLVANATPSTATPDLLREFEDVLISTSTGSLTPPESPRDQTSLITLLQEIEPCTSSSNDIDTIVRNTQAENMIPLNLQHQQQQQQQPSQHYIQQSPPSPCDPWSSPSMGSSGSCSDSGYDDPDWSPSSPSLHTLTSSNGNNHHHNGNSSSSSSSSSSTRRKRAAATTTEERKLRKKEQNKNAATRYRQKKKQEIEVIIGEERELLDKHERLKADATEITREIRYLKSLLRDLYKAKGLLP